jgi:hypothetical protein
VETKVWVIRIYSCDPNNDNVYAKGISLVDELDVGCLTPQFKLTHTRKKLRWRERCNEEVLAKVEWLFWRNLVPHQVRPHLFPELVERAAGK